MEEHVIFVREYGQTYIAHSKGKQASCTAGPEQAANTLAMKLFGDRPFNLKTVTKSAYIATEEGKSEI